MSYLSQKDYLVRLKSIQYDNKSKERKQNLIKEKMKYFPKFKLPSTSKLVLLGAVLLCVHIIHFCENIIISTGDTSALYALIGIPATLIPIIWGYYSKAKAENTVGGIVYDTAMAQMQQQNNVVEPNDAGCVDVQG